MARIANLHQLSVTMDNGHPVPLRPDWERFEAYRGPKGEVRVELIVYADGGEDWLTQYDRLLIDGLGRDLADGETFASQDGATWTRYGDELHVRTPGQELVAA